MSDRKKLVFDTNTLISAATYAHSLPARVFGQAKQAHDVFISAETLEELEAVLARKKFDRYFADDEARRWMFLAEYVAAATLVSVSICSTACHLPCR